MLIDPPKRFSESALWDFQRNYFNTEGIEAWANQVPFYVTSNPFIANTYATVFIHFLMDWLNTHPQSKKHAFYLLELGTGSGRFSFYVLQRIQALQKTYGLEHIKICYVMSDFTESNLRYWQQHPRLQIFLENGSLDFAIYNLEQDTSIQLIHKKITLNSNTLKNPLTVFANYIFDSVIQDAFTVKKSKLSELLFSLKSEPENLDSDHKPIDWSKLEIDYQNQTLEKPRYNDPLIEKVLTDYADLLEDTHFLFPIGSLLALKNLLSLSNHKLFLIASDKAYSSLESLENLSHPQPSFHGSFSMMVNFHAIARYFEVCGGDYFLPTARDGIKTAAFCMGFNLTSLPHTTSAIAEHLEALNPADYFSLHKRVRDNIDSYDLITLASHLAFAKWDPHIYLLMNKRLCQLVTEAPDHTTLSFLEENMAKIMAQYYEMPSFGNVPFEIGTFFYSHKNYDKALEYYQVALKGHTKEFGVHYNLGLCHYYLGRAKKALTHFKKALKANEDSKEAKEWVTFLN